MLSLSSPFSCVNVLPSYPFCRLICTPTHAHTYAHTKFNITIQATNRELKRLDSIARSPIYAHLNECLIGLSSIRAYRAWDRMAQQNAEKLNAQVCLVRPCCVCLSS